MLILGWKNDKKANAYHSWDALVDQNGRIIFEHEGLPIDASIRNAAFTTSKGCETNDGYALLICTDQEGRLQTKNELIYVNQQGVEQWRIEVPETFKVQEILASPNGDIYLAGSTGLLSDDDFLLNQQSTVACYSDRGEKNGNIGAKTSLRFGAEPQAKRNVISTEATISDGITACVTTAEIYCARDD